MRITNAKSVIKSVLRNCSYSKRMDTRPKTPLMGELQRQRLSTGLPAFTGVNCFGPLTIKLSKQTRKTCTTAKRYGAVFTCLTTWEVH